MAEIYNLDLKDKKILFYLDKNARTSLSEIGRKVRLSQEVVFHRVNKLQEKGVIKRFQTVVTISKLGYIAPKVYLQLQDITKEKYQEIYDYLMGHESVFWFGVCQGRWDLLIAYWSKDAFEFGRLVDDLLHKFSPHILEKQVTIGKNTFQYNRRWLYNDNAEPVEFTFGSELDKVNLDKVDSEIIKYLANNARLQVTELSRLTKTTTNIVHYRIKQLEKNKIISGYKFALNVNRLGYEVCKSFIYLKNITEKRRKELVEFCKLHQNVINIVLCVGQWDMEIEFEVRNFDEFYNLMDEIKNKFSDIIKNYESVIFKDEPKQSFVPNCYPQIKEA